MRKLLITTAAMAMMAGAALAQDMVRLGTEGAYAPWNFINDKGEVDGFERELPEDSLEYAPVFIQAAADWSKTKASA